MSFFQGQLVAQSPCASGFGLAPDGAKHWFHHAIELTCLRVSGLLWGMSDYMKRIDPNDPPRTFKVDGVLSYSSRDDNDNPLFYIDVQNGLPITAEAKFGPLIAVFPADGQEIAQHLDQETVEQGAMLEGPVKTNLPGRIFWLYVWLNGKLKKIEAQRPREYESPKPGQVRAR